MVRYIRLREWGVNLDTVRCPTDMQLELSDGSLPRRDYRIRTDDNGFIRSGRDAGPGSLRILVLGDSIVESLFVDETKRLCPRLEAALARHGGGAVEVLNGGMTGSTTLHLLSLLLTKGIPLRPNVVLLMSGIMDLDTALRPDGFWTDEPRLTPIVSVPQAAPPAADPILAEADFDSRTRLLRCCAAIAAIHDISFVLATLPHRIVEDAYVTRRFASPQAFAHGVALRRAMNESTRAAAAAAGVPLIDLEARLADQSDLFYDLFHLNEKGAEIVAEELCSGLRGRLGRDAAESTC